MAQATNELSTRIVTRDGIITVSVVDKVSPDRIARMLFKGSAAAILGSATDNTPLISRSIKDLLVFPFSEIS
jgi:hypothetical protein